MTNEKNHEMNTRRDNTLHIKCIRWMVGLSFVIYHLSFSQAVAQTYSLQQLKDSALQNNIAMRSARQAIDISQHQRKEAFTKYFPTVSGTGLWFNASRSMAKMNMNPSEMIPSELGTVLAQSLPVEALASLANPVSFSMMKHGTAAGISAIQPVFAGGQIVNGNKLAKIGEEASQLQLQLSAKEVEKTTEQYYWQIVCLQEKLKTLDAVDNLLADIHKDVDVAVRAGVAMNNDLLQVQLRQNDIESSRMKLNNGISIVKLLLAQYCGLSPNPSLSRDGSAYSFDIEMPDMDKQGYSLPSPVGEGQGVRSLPEYQLLTKQVEAASLQRKMAFGQQLPSVAVGAGYNYHHILDAGRSFGLVFATVSIPISDWWSGSHVVKRKDIEYQRALDERQDKAELLQIRIQKAWNDVAEAQQQLLITQRSIEQATENLRLSKNHYQAGISKMSDLLEAQLLYQQACDKHTDAYADYQNKLLDYRQATGLP